MQAGKFQTRRAPTLKELRAFAVMRLSESGQHRQVARREYKSLGSTDGSLKTSGGRLNLFSSGMFCPDAGHKGSDAAFAAAENELQQHGGSDKGYRRTPCLHGVGGGETTTITSKPQSRFVEILKMLLLFD